MGLASQVFFPGAPSTIDEQAISYFIVNRCFKAEIIFSSLIFYLPSAECFFFFTACTIVYVVTRLSSALGWTSGYLSVVLLHNILWYLM